MWLKFRNSISTIAAAAAIAGLAVIQPASAQEKRFPEPTDEAALYEAAKKEGTLVWYTGSALDVAKALGAEFEKKYPGITVEPLRLAGPQLYQRFSQETAAGQNIADLMMISDKPSMAALIQQGHIDEWKVPTSDRILEADRIGNYAYADRYVTLGIAYNVNQVTPEEVKLLGSDWAAVLDPRFKGRFAVTSMKCGTCYAPLHMFMDPKYADRFGPDFLKKIAAQKPAVYDDILVSLDRVVAGEQDFVYWTFEAIAGVKAQQGAPIRWIFPSPTPNYSNAFSGISKYAPHPNAARLFLNWWMSDDGAKAIQTYYTSGTSLQGVEDIRNFTKESWYKAPTEIYKPDFERWERDYNKDLDLWIQDLKAAQ